MALLAVTPGLAAEQCVKTEVAKYADTARCILWVDGKLVTRNDACKIVISSLKNIDDSTTGDGFSGDYGLEEFTLSGVPAVMVDNLKLCGGNCYKAPTVARRVPRWPFTFGPEAPSGGPHTRTACAATTTSS